MITSLALDGQWKPYPILRRLSSAWTSASVQRPQPVSVGIQEKGPGAWTRLFAWAYRDRSRIISMTTVGLDEAPARSSLARWLLPS